MKWKEQQNYEDPPTGSHLARCVGLIDLGSQPHSFQGRSWTSRDVRIVWELVACVMTGKYKPEMKGKRFNVSRRFTQSMHGRSTLRKMLVGWRGRDFTPEELAGFDPKKLLGVGCRLGLVQNQNGFTDVDSIAPLGGEQCPKAEAKPVFLSLERDEFDRDVFNGLSERLQEAIKSSAEYQALFGGAAPGEEPQSSPEDDGRDSDNPF
jgi:hypothetical protein